MKIILIALIAVIFSGCTVTTPNKLAYRITPLMDVNSIQKSTCKNKSLKVSQAFSASNLMSTKMNYTSDEQQEFTYTESEWSRSPSHSITAALLTSIRSTNLFKTVNNYKSRSRSNLILETNIEEFIQHYEEDNSKSFVKIAISFSLIDAKSSKTLDSQTVIVELDVESLNAKGGVVGLNTALGEVLQKNNEWLGSVCK